MKEHRFVGRDLFDDAERRMDAIEHRGCRGRHAQAGVHRLAGDIAAFFASRR
ncbi:hypothetical protein BJ978_000375 [Agromyces terreus]|uniref:Uncharacterized protein n=1 Tax=Agromyces terreus TaxID=424795 RepID=A0A9X2KAL7_9MICO|nr:hypothetical protein [Agromyces terreus]MCP2369699.1 hypothetical protein [Agromyces terreus]